MIYDYAIKIDGKYFKDYVYSDKNTYGRFSGGATNIGNYQTDDIIDLILTDNIEYTTSRRNISEKIKIIYDIEKFKNKKVSIIPV